MKLSKNKYDQLLDNIGSTLQKARENAIKAINTELVKANWEILADTLLNLNSKGKKKQIMAVLC